MGRWWSGRAQPASNPLIEVILPSPAIAAPVPSTPRTRTGIGNEARCFPPQPNFLGPSPIHRQRWYPLNAVRHAPETLTYAGLYRPSMTFEDVLLDMASSYLWQTLLPDFVQACRIRRVPPLIATPESTR